MVELKPKILNIDTKSLSLRNKTKSIHIANLKELHRGLFYRPEPN